MGYKYNWIKPEEYSFNNFLLMDRWMINMIVDNYGADQRFIAEFSTLLDNNPAVKWCLIHRCPEKKDFIESMSADADKNLTQVNLLICLENI